VQPVCHAKLPAYHRQKAQKLLPGKTEILSPGEISVPGIENTAFRDYIIWIYNILSAVKGF